MDGSLYLNKEDQKLNQAFDTQNMDEMLNQEIRTAVNMEQQKDGYNADFYSVQKTEQDTEQIHILLNGLKTGTLQVEESEVKTAKLEAIQGRNLSHLLLNDQKALGDSDEMDKVKNAIRTLEKTMTETHAQPMTVEDVDKMLEAYNTAMDMCQMYCDKKHPWLPAGQRRKAMVKGTLRRLTKEANNLALCRRYIAQGVPDAEKLKNGTEILSLIAVNKITEKKTRVTDQLAEKKAEHDLIKDDFKAIDDEYKALYQAKFAQYGFFGLNKMATDPELLEFQQKHNYNERKEHFDRLVREIADLQKIEDARLNKEREDIRSATARREQALEKNAETISNLPQSVQPIVKMLLDDRGMVDQFANPSKLTASDKMLLPEFVKVRKVLAQMKPGEEQAVSIRVAGHFVRFIQDKGGNIDMQVGKDTVTIPFTSTQLDDRISEDIIKHRKLYGDAAAADVVSELKTDLKEMDRRDLLKSRQTTIMLLHEKTGVPKTLMNNLEVDQLKFWAEKALNPTTKTKTLKKEFTEVCKNANELMKEDTVNTVMNLELMNLGKQMSDVVELKIQEKEDKSLWNEDERKIRDLAADLIFSKDTWVADGLQQKPEERIRKVLIEHADAIGVIIADQFRDEEKKKEDPNGIIGKMLDSLLVMNSDGKGVAEMRAKLTTALSEVADFIKGKVIENTEEGFARDVALGALKSKALLADKVRQYLKDMDEEDMENLSGVEEQIDEAVSGAMEGIQEAFDDCVDEIFKSDEGEQEQAPQDANMTEEELKLFNDRKQEKKARTQRINEMTAEADGLKKSIELSRSMIKEYKTDREKLSPAMRNKYKNLENDEKTSIAADEARLAQLEKRLLEENKAAERLERTERIEATKKRIESRKAIKDRLEREVKEMVATQNALQAQSDEFRKKAIELSSDPANAEQVADFMRRSEEAKTRKNELTETIKEKNKSLEDYVKKTGDELGQIVQDSLKGKKGQGLFMKNVLKTYFKSMGAMDQRSMLAGAIRNSNPAQAPAGGKEMDFDQKVNAMSDMLGGMFKGAGPLLQKMLQGLPTDGLTLGLKRAIEDTQDNLAHIPTEVVKGHMEGIVARSAGKISKIEVVKSLGAASVGQAFLCKVYGPKMKEGKNMVIKLLRPDVRNRMMREKETMLNAARMTDQEGKSQIEIDMMRKKKQIGGMEATYLGNLQRIEEELDLTIEAENCKKGQIYDKPLEDENTTANVSDSMKISTLVDPSSDTLMMEIAGSKTVKRYVTDAEDRMAELMLPFCEKEKILDEEGNDTGKVKLKKDGDGNIILRKDLTNAEKLKLSEAEAELSDQLQDMEIRQKALAQSAEKWVTEGIFEQGYYHGDMHAGNIMISEKGVTVIDFGNATTLSKDQQTEITKMMIAATVGDVEAFRHGFHKLLENTPEDVYQEKREELTLLITEIMQMGDATKPAERIAVALVRAQEIGLELPPAIANFSSGQMRLQNAVKNMNTTLKSLRSTVKAVRKASVPKGASVNVDPVANFKKETARYTRKDYIDRELDIKISELELTITKESVADELYNTRKSSYLAMYGLQDTMKAEEARKGYDILNRILQEQLTEDEVKAFRESGWDLEETFPEVKALRKNCSLSRFKDIENIVKAVCIYNEPENIADKEAYLTSQPLLKNGERNVETILRNLKASNLEAQNAEFFVEPKEIDLMVNTYYQLREKPDLTPQETEQMHRLENEIWEYHKEREESKIANKTSVYKNSLKQLLPSATFQKETLEDWGRLVDLLKAPVESCVNNKTNGAELQRVWDDFYAVLKNCVKIKDSPKDHDFKAYIVEHEAEMNEKFEAFFEVLIKAQAATFKEMKENTRDRTEISENEPRDFLEIMGEVMGRYKGRLIWRLGILKAWRMKKKMEAAEAEAEGNG